MVKREGKCGKVRQGGDESREVRGFWYWWLLRVSSSFWTLDLGSMRRWKRRLK